MPWKSAFSNPVIVPSFYSGWGLEQETLTYLGLSGISLTAAQIATLDTNIKTLKYGAGTLSLGTLTAKMSLVAPLLVTNVSTDIRKYIGFYANFDDGSNSIKMKLAIVGSETLGTELLTAVTNSVAVPYDTFAATGKNITSAIVGVGGGGANYNAGTSISGALYKCVTSLTVNSGTAPDMYLFNIAGWDTNYTLTAGAQNKYWTSGKDGVTDFQATVYKAAAQNFALIASLKQVLTPDATGAFYTGAVDGGVNPNIADWTVTITKS